MLNFIMKGTSQKKESRIMNDNHTKRERNVVLTFGELGLIHCLGTENIPVYTASEGTKSLASLSRFSKKHLTFSSYETDEFIKELVEFGKSMNSKPVLMCHDDRALLNISENRDLLKDYFLFRLPDAAMVNRILNKLLFCRLCKEYDLPAPESKEIAEFAQLPEVKDDLKSPYIIKPTFNHYWYDENFEEVVGNYKKAYICQTYEELESLYLKISQINPSVVIQEYIMGDDSNLYDVNLHISEEGEINSYVIGQKLRVYPPKAGWGSYVKTVFDDEMFEICADIIDKLELKGMANIQFKKDERTDEPKLIEIHTRTSIFDFLGASAGQNIPARYYSDLTGVEMDNSQTYKTGIKYINLARDLRLFVRHRNEYELSLLEWIKTYRNVAVYDGMIIKDPKVFYYELQSALAG